MKYLMMYEYMFTQSDMWTPRYDLDWDWKQPKRATPSTLLLNIMSNL